jgi:biopolymer transport protein ExbB
MDIEVAMNAFTGLGARWVLWVLVGLSVGGFGVAVERGILMLMTRDNPQKLHRNLRRWLTEGDVERAIRGLEASPSFEARVARAGLGAHGAGSAEERMAAEKQVCKLRMERSLAFLGTLGNNAPFVGLLGTVIGIIGAFHALNSGMGQVSAGLMAEIGEALVATAVGLVVALPAVAFYNTFQRIIKARLAMADVLGHEVLAYFKSLDERESSTDYSALDTAAE